MNPVPLVVIILGLVLASIVAIDAWVLSISVLTFVALPIILWKVGEPPTLAFCFMYQWVFCNLGYFVWHYLGYYPDTSLVGYLDQAVLLSNVGLLAIALSVRLSAFCFSISAANDESLLQRLNLPLLFSWTIITQSISWLVLISPSKIWFGGAQIIYNLLLYRDVPLVLLLWGSLRQRRHFKLALMGIAFAAIPTLASAHAKLSHYLFLAIIVLLAEWIPRSRSHLFPRVNPNVPRYFVTALAATFVFTAIWFGGVKAVWRQMSNEGKLVGSTTGRLGQLADTVSDVSKDFSFASAFDTLSKRTSSDLLYFSFVLDRVPYKIPHEDGALTEAALRHTVMPRFLFPDKEILRNASWMVRKYAGVNCADESSGASISFGYMAEWYVDWGAFGMLLSLAGWGMAIFWGNWLLEKAAGSRLIGQAMFIPVGLQHLASYGADVAKMLGGFVQTVLVAAVVLYLWKQRFPGENLARKPGRAIARR